MSVFDMDDFRDPQVVEAERQRKKENSMVGRAVNSGLDIAHQMLQANEMALHMSLRDAMNDEKKQMAEDYRAMREAAYIGTPKDERYASKVEERARQFSKSRARTSPSADKGDDVEFY